MSKNLKILQYNVDRAIYEKKERLEKLVKVIRDKNPDIINLQEININESLYIKEQTGKKYLINSENEECILTNLEIESTSIRRREDYVIALLKNNCHSIAICSLHLPWGPHEVKRLEKIKEIDKEISFIADLEPFRVDKFTGKMGNQVVGYLSGDFNATPESDTIRYLKGLGVYSNHSTLYIDSFEVKEDDEYSFTVDSQNPYAINTARNSKVDGKFPDRRIDYIFSRGWAYGRPGAGIKYEILGRDENNLSDHYGILATFLC